MKSKIIPVYLVFLVMGLVDSVGPMVSLAKESFDISITMATLLPLLAYIMYGILSVPIGVLQDKKGKKFILNTGLIIAVTGLLIPVLTGMRGHLKVDTGSLYQFYTILSAILLLGAGGSILQVAGNPFIRDVSAEGRYSSNLSMAQAFITVGSSMGFLLPPFMLWAFGFDWSIMFPVFSALAIICILWLNTMKVSEKRSGDQHATIRSCLRLLKDRYVVVMVLGIFIYCGVEIAMSSHIPLLLKQKHDIAVEKMGLLISWSLFYLPILGGRLLGSLILRHMKPKKFLLLTCSLALTGILLIFTDSFVLNLGGILMAGMGFANIFPLIFSMTIDRMPEHANELSGLMVSAVAGGAFIPPLTGLVADNISITAAFAVPLLCILYLLSVAILNFRAKAKA